MTHPPRVYAVQVPARRENGAWVHKYDLSAAERFGELVRVLPYGNVPRDSEATAELLHEALRGEDGFDFGTDFLLLLGDPVAIAQAVLALGQRQHIHREYGDDATIRALKWDRRAERYEPYVLG
jgi:hypothetical protein